MEKRRLNLVKKRKNKKMHKLLALLFVFVLLAIGVYFVIQEFSIESIEVVDNTTYSDDEVIDALKKGNYVENTLAMVVINKLTGDTYLPFVEKVTMSVEKPHILKLKLKERLRAGVFKYMDRNVYFDSDGIAQESRNKTFDGVPVVTGVKFDKLVLGEKIPVDGDYFDIIVMITKKIVTYQLDISKIHFEGEDNIYLISGKYQIYLGSSQHLTNKMSRISEILKSVSKKSKSGIIDMHLFTDEKDIITFRKK